jgi:uncharacterized protein (DUF952 family)
MTRISTKPAYVYKLISSTAPPPDPLPDRLPLSSLDRESGFIHLSTAPQIRGTLKHFFADEPRVYVLRIEYVRVEIDIKWEDPKADSRQTRKCNNIRIDVDNVLVCGTREDEGMFPHLYNGGRLGKDEIEDMVVWENDGFNWDVRLREAESWLLH